MASQKRLFRICFLAMFVAVFAAGACVAQQPAPTDIWRMVPSNSLLVAGFDGRPENLSMQAMARAEDAQTHDLRLKQQDAMRKAVEKLATLFGVSLDFTKDIASWADQQWALVLLPGDKGQIQPVFIIASTDPAAADAALQKLVAPWQRVGELTSEPNSGYTITAFKACDNSVEVYAAACGSLMAFSPSKASLEQALKGGGFASGSAAEKALGTLSGSMFYMFADPGLLQTMGERVPVDALAMGLYAVDTGFKVRMLGYPDKDLAPWLQQMLPAQQPGALVVNPGVPTASLAAVSLPDIKGLVAMAGMSGMSNDPMFGLLEAISDTQISATMTAALPLPAGLVSAMAPSEEAAADKVKAIAASAARMNLSAKSVTISGVKATAIEIPDCQTAYLAQIGKYVVLASDAQSLSGAAASISGEQTGLAQSQAYKETMAGLGNSNLLTAYVNLAPLQGIGYLVEGMGIGQIEPLYGSFAKGLENAQALGIGVGYDGEAAEAAIFVRAKPEVGPVIGPLVTTTAAIAAITFPFFAGARETARTSVCVSNLKEMALAAMMYSSDHGGKLPTITKWREQLEPYLPVELECPSEEAIYAFNKNLSGLNINNVLNPSEVIIFFEADPGLHNSSGSRADARLPHNGKGWFAYLDGHVKASTEVPAQSHWVPEYAAPKPAKKAPVSRRPRK